MLSKKWPLCLAPVSNSHMNITDKNSVLRDSNIFKFVENGMDTKKIYNKNYILIGCGHALL